VCEKVCEKTKTISDLCQCQPFWETLAYRVKEVGINLIFPESMTFEEVLRAFLKNTLATLSRDGWGYPDPPPEVAQFLAGGPRPPSTPAS